MRPPEPYTGRAVRVASDVGDLWMPADDQVMLPYLRSAGTWETSEGELIASLLKPNTRFLDVGANIGYFSAFVARRCPQGTIDAVEPDVRNLDLLRLNLWAHAPHAQIWPVALGNARSVVSLRLDAANWGNTRVRTDEPAAAQLAAMVPADELFAGRTFDVIKIDVQGFESDVMLGMQRSLRAARHVSLVVEFFPGAIEERGERPLEVLGRYRDLGLDRVVSVRGKLERLSDQETLSLCRDAGVNGFVNLLLRK